MYPIIVQHVALQIITHSDHEIMSYNAVICAIIFHKEIYEHSVYVVTVFPCCLVIVRQLRLLPANRV